MRQKYYLEATSRRLQDSCPDQACCLLLVYSLSHNDKSNFEETCPYCFQLLVLDNSQAHLKPNPNSHTKNQNTETSYSRSKKFYTQFYRKKNQMKKKFEKLKAVLLQKYITNCCKTHNKAVRHCNKSSFLSALKSNPSTPMSKVDQKIPERLPAQIFKAPTSGQSTPICPPKNVSQTKKHFPQLKMLLGKNESKKNPKVYFINFLSSL
uniref:Uncharacterized protein n=1 Tax=Oryctolagus cuniculus TaxID=9986 RepID=A0A5F9CFT6_RABIT